MASSIRSTCPYCGVGCGVIAAGDTIKGDPDHPANFGKLCSKGSALGETLSLEGRLLYPEISGERVSWDRALNTVAKKFGETIAQHGPDSVAFYVSGQCLTEDYYVANKLMKGFIGSGNIDTNSRLCMASSVAGHTRAFGADVVPGCYEDLDEADLIVLVGSNLAWCHPVLAQRIAGTKAARSSLRIVNVDPRHTATSELADTQLSLAPGSDVALFNGLLRWLELGGHRHAGYVARHVGGADEALEAAHPFDLCRVSKETGLSSEDLKDFYTAFARTEKVVTVYSQGVNQWSSGTDKVNAILNCHLLTGRIGRTGMGPFSVTGQPNAMGGREVGGLATMLAAHRRLADAKDRESVRRFWKAPMIVTKPGLKAVEMFDAVADGRIKALWIMATNPVVSLPDADFVRNALKGCFTVVSDIMRETDTTACADMLLPALGWGEKDGTVTNSERMISRQRAFLHAPGEARADWRVMADVASRMGWSEAFDYHSSVDVFREHAALSSFENDGRFAFDIGGLAGLSDAAYREMPPTRWPVRATENRSTKPSRFFADGGFYSDDGKARMIPVSPSKRGAQLSTEFPLILNTGRIRDHWHTMTRTAKSPRLSQHIAEPYIEIHPEDAIRFDLREADLAEIESPQGLMIARVLVTDRQRPGSVFAPMHWTAQTASAGRVDALVARTVDPVSGQPESKRTPVSVKRLPAVWQGFAVTRNRPANIDAEYWAAARCVGGWRLELGGTESIEDPSRFAHTLFGVAPTIEYQDTRNGTARFAAFDGDTALGILFLAPRPVSAARDWLAASLSSSPDQVRLLAGRPGSDMPDQGAIVCVCEGVGINTIAGAIHAGATDVDAIGVACRAGTNCGSCRSELAAMISSASLKEAAE